MRTGRFGVGHRHPPLIARLLLERLGRRQLTDRRPHGDLRPKQLSPQRLVGGGLAVVAGRLTVDGGSHPGNHVDGVLDAVVGPEHLWDSRAVGSDRRRIESGWRCSASAHQQVVLAVAARAGDVHVPGGPCPWVRAGHNQRRAGRVASLRERPVRRDPGVEC